jgi:hypothetical protein
MRPQALAATATAVTLLAIPALGAGGGPRLALAPSARSLGQQRATAYQALLVGDHSAASRPQHAVVPASAAP